MLRMKVKVVGIDQNSMLPVVVIADSDEKGFIPIVIGPAEANAITLELEGIKPPRPVTHDLLRNLLETLHVKLDRIVISDLREETYFARIFLKTRDGELDVDARPSDAIALALRTNAPIYISEEVAAKALISKPIDDQEMDDFRKFLEKISPADFKNHLGFGEPRESGPKGA
ncbi:MAG: bifunctional nuclease family protein [Firmicutes bacterium]|nr:bifunctional nuclease family protein [Bacillota bacterium]